MFNRSVAVILPRTETQYVTREVHEHRAPTDQSVALLREMEEKARAEIVKAVHVGDASFECVVHLNKFPVDGSTGLMAIFSLNGKKMIVEYREHDWRSTREQMLVKLRDLMAEKIATEVLIPALQALKL